VDLGVCYYNLGDTNEAERLFRLALTRDPHHAIALFNLGIVSEHREKYDEALDYYHRALQGAQPADMAEPIAQAMQRVMQKQGKVAPPLPVVP
jgi:tetratricopeptide (TPR) repeat protein